MRTAAGILLIFAAFFNIFGAIKYMGGGAFVGGGSKLVDMAAEQSKKEGRAFDEQQARESMRDAKQMLGAPPAVWLSYGLFLLVTVGTSIAGAVCLFRGRAAKFIIVAAALEIVGEAVGFGLSGFGFLRSLGIVSGIFGIIGARSIMAQNRAPADPPPAAAMPM
jgi:hypothetical protein